MHRCVPVPLWHPTVHETTGGLFFRGCVPSPPPSRAQQTLLSAFPRPANLHLHGTAFCDGDTVVFSFREPQPAQSTANTELPRDRATVVARATGTRRRSNFHTTRAQFVPCQGYLPSITLSSYLIPCAVWSQLWLINTIFVTQRDAAPET